MNTLQVCKNDQAKRLCCVAMIATVLIVSIGCRRTSKEADFAPRHQQRNEPPQLDSDATCDSSVTDWPRPYGPHGNCVSDERNIRLDWTNDGPPEIWSSDVGTGYSAPVVADNHLILLHRVKDAEMTTCFDAESGLVSWEHSSATTFECEYSEYSSGPYSTPVINKDIVYIQSATGVLRALSMADGSEIWVRDLSTEYGVPKHGYGVGHSPLLEDDMLIVNVGGEVQHSTVVAVNAATGKTAWTAGQGSKLRNNGSHSTPAAATIHGQRLVFVLTSNHVLCLRPESGRIQWAIPFGTDSRDTPNSTTPVVYDDMVFISMFRAGAFCLKISANGDYTELWSNRRSLETCYNPIACVDGHLFGWHSFDRTLRCVDIATGAVRWKQHTPLARGNHIVVGGHLLILGEQGHLGCVSISDQRYDAVFQTESTLLVGPCFTMPALSGKRMYLRNERRLVCLNLAENNADESVIDE